MPNAELIAAIQQLKPGDALSKDNMILAVRTPDDEVPEIITGTIEEFTQPFTLIDQVWKIYQNNGAQIREDFTLITKGRKSAPVTDPFTRIYNNNQVFIEEGVEIRAALLNADNGPIYLGKNSSVQEGALIRGPFALCEGSHGKHGRQG